MGVAVLAHVLAMQRPDIFLHSSLQVVETESPAIHLAVFAFNGSWEFITFTSCFLCMVSLDAWRLPAAASHYYKKDGHMCAIYLGQQVPVVLEGHSVCAWVVSCADMLALVLKWHQGHSQTGLEGEFAQVGLDYYQTAAEWFLEKATRHERIVLLHRNFGLMHDSAPFAESSTVVIVDDNDEVARLEAILQTVGYSGSSHRYVVPISFPPALTDADAALQDAYLAAAMAPENDKCRDNLRKCTITSFEAHLGDTSDHLADLQEQDLFDVLGRLRSTVNDALTELRRAKCRFKALEDVAQKIIKEAADAAVEQCVRVQRIKAEWQQREHWVKKQSVEGRGPKKGKNKKRS